LPKLTEIQGGVTAPAGFLAGGLHCGIKKKGEPDLAIIFSERPATVGGVFTKNRVRAAAVGYSRKVAEGGVARAMVVNSGNANAVTGEQGRRDAETMARTTAECLGVSPNEVAVASTGTIGQLMPMDIVNAGIKELASSLSREGGESAARAIMTTDTFPKSFAVKVPLSTGEIAVGGIAKGVGMICPDLATMLAFITTDADIEAGLLASTLREVTETSFNSITVDGDCSTNDTVLALANGASGTRPIDESSADYPIFKSALQRVCDRLAEMLVRDGEGATKLVRIHVVGAAEREGARKIAKKIGNSLLVKTAIFGNDANWGRIMMALGNADVEIKADIIDIHLGTMALLKTGSPQGFSEEEAKEILSQKEVDFTVNLHMGDESATVLTCDLSYEYVKINAEYRT